MAIEKCVRVGVVGLGFGRVVHIPALRLLPAVEVSAVSARSQSSIDRVKLEYNIELGFLDPLELINHPQVDAVVLAVPPSVQPNLIRECIQKRKHVFLEKPVGGGYLVANELLGEIQESDVIHGIDFEFCDLETWNCFRSELPKIGQLRQVHVTWNTETVGLRNYTLHGTSSWKVDLNFGGGTLNNLGSHAFYYLESFFGPIESLYCSLIPQEATDTVVRLLIQWETFIGQVVISTNSPGGNGHRIEAFGSEGSLRLENPTLDYMRGFRVFRSTRDEIGMEVSAPASPTDCNDGRVMAVRTLLDRWINGIKNQSQIQPNLSHGVRVEYLIDMCRRSHDEKSWVQI